MAQMTKKDLKDYIEELLKLDLVSKNELTILLLEALRRGNIRFLKRINADYWSKRYLHERLYVSKDYQATRRRDNRAYEILVDYYNQKLKFPRDPNIIESGFQNAITILDMDMDAVNWGSDRSYVFLHEVQQLIQHFKFYPRPKKHMLQFFKRVVTVPSLKPLALTVLRQIKQQHGKIKFGK